MLTLGFANAGARDTFVSGGSDEILRQAAIDVVGVDWRIEAIVDPAPRPTPAPRPRRPQRRRARRGAAGACRRAAQLAPPTTADTPARRSPAEPRRGPAGPVRRPAVHAAARGAIAADPVGRREPRPATTGPTPTPTPTRDDPDADDSGLGSAELLERELGAQMIEEIRHE